ncbi:hypothetical protein FM020_04130 [Acinetobacter tandoii]|nr:hypothetical protein FM020_04130 [Acinetobacter tandoii]
MSKAIKNFEDALQRLIDGKPRIISIPYSINNDTVALEAGRQRGAIKKSRPELAELLKAIAKAEACRTSKNVTEKIDVRDIKLQEAHKKIQLLEAELSEIKDKYKKQLEQLTSVMYRNNQLQRELRVNKTPENNLLDFMVE